jgi:hypothetical protein
MYVLYHSLSSILRESNGNAGHCSKKGELFITKTRAAQEEVRECVRDTTKNENHHGAWRSLEYAY